MTLKDGDTFGVYATSRKKAIELVRANHYENMDYSEFKREYDPCCAALPKNQIVSIRGENLGEVFKKPAAAWAKGKVPRLFYSNTYEG